MDYIGVIIEHRADGVWLTGPALCDICTHRYEASIGPFVATPGATIYPPRMECPRCLHFAADFEIAEDPDIGEGVGAA